MRKLVQDSLRYRTHLLGILIIFFFIHYFKCDKTGYMFRIKRKPQNAIQCNVDNYNYVELIHDYEQYESQIHNIDFSGNFHHENEKRKQLEKIIARLEENENISQEFYDI